MPHDREGSFADEWGLLEAGTTHEALIMPPPTSNDPIMIWTPSGASGNPDGTWQRSILGRQLDEGGMAVIYRDAKAPNSWVHKIMTHEFTNDEREGMYWKWKRMAQLHQPLAHKLSCAVFPDALIFRSMRKVPSPDLLIGCRMPFIADTIPVASVSRPPEDLAREGIVPGATIDTVRAIGLNIITGLAAMHEHGICLGDPNANNILVNPKTYGITFIDPDSYVSIIRRNINGQIREHRYMPAGTTPGYRSPSVIQQLKSYGRLMTYTESDDTYVLAIHLFRLLVAGFHPFNMAIGQAEEAESKMLAGTFPFAANGGLKKCFAKDLYERVPGSLREGFHRAFVDKNPPTAASWKKRFLDNWGYL